MEPDNLAREAEPAGLGPGEAGAEDARPRSALAVGRRANRRPTTTGRGSRRKRTIVRDRREVVVPPATGTGFLEYATAIAAVASWCLHFTSSV